MLATTITETGTELGGSVGYEGSYLHRLRQKVGSELVLIPAVQVLVFDPRQRLLLLRRADFGQWGLVSGNGEEGLSFGRLAVTELRQEADIAVSEFHLEPFASASDPAYTMVYPNGDVLHSFALCFAVRNWTGPARADGDEMTEAAFVDLDALPEPRLPEVDNALRLWAAYELTGRFQAS